MQIKIITPEMCFSNVAVSIVNILIRLTEKGVV